MYPSRLRLTTIISRSYLCLNTTFLTRVWLFWVIQEDIWPYRHNAELARRSDSGRS